MAQGRRLRREPTAALRFGRVTWLVVLYVVGFALEGAGLALVAVDIRADRDRARQITAEPGPRWSKPRSRPGPIQSRGPHAGIDTEARRREADNVRAAQTGYAVTMGAVLDILTGSLRRRAIGAGLILAGLVAGMVDNIASLYVG